ncbi:uncharacterized protein [Pempheris klunzingeri]|uniref:uncharacterized protein isoform X1 n=1 Tax=Pempheris klunzingeri TaxID=3127111 RepID=UPI00397EA74B
MAGHWWSCVLGLLCIPAEATLSPMEVLQSPLYISQMRVNSTAEITCSTSRSDPMGFSLHRRFHSDRSIVYLSIDNGQVTRNNIAPEFTGRIHASRDQQIREGYGFTLRLSLLGLEDTDMYYCRWNYFNSEKEKREILSSNGTVIIIRERAPQQCSNHSWDLILVTSSVTALTLVLFVFIAALIARCKTFERRLRVTGAVTPSRPDRPSDRKVIELPHPG